MQISFKIHKILQWLERELVAVLAVGIVGLGSVWTLAGTSGTATFNVTVLPAGETITVVAPNGGESWEIDTSQNITWTATATITDVKIELQRSVGGSWETIVASTTNDGTYPWVVTSAATTVATIRVSKVGDASINDISDAVFSITTPATPTPGGGGGSGDSMKNVYPLINDVTPSVFDNTSETTLTVIGANFEYNTIFKLGETQLRMVWSGNGRVSLIVPVGFKAGQYSLTAYNSNGRFSSWGNLVTVRGAYYADALVGQSPVEMTLTAGQTAKVWVEMKNTGTIPWYNYGRNPVRLGTSKDRTTPFRYWNWIKFNRPVVVTNADTSVSNRRVVVPGETGRFTFTIKAPTKAGLYTETYGAVVEWKQWMGAQVTWKITVVPRAQAPVVKQPTTPSTVSPTPSLPGTTTTTTEFYDCIEGWLRGVSNFFSWLVSGF